MNVLVSSDSLFRLGKNYDVIEVSLYSSCYQLLKVFVSICLDIYFAEFCMTNSLYECSDIGRYHLTLSSYSCQKQYNDNIKYWEPVILLSTSERDKMQGWAVCLLTTPYFLR